MSAKVIHMRPIAKAYPKPREGVSVTHDGDDMIVTVHGEYSSVQHRLTRSQLFRLGDIIQDIRGRAR